MMMACVGLVLHDALDGLLFFFWFVVGVEFLWVLNDLNKPPFMVIFNNDNLRTNLHNSKLALFHFA